jgi:hypothetical protein
MTHIADVQPLASSLSKSESIIDLKSGPVNSEPGGSIVVSRSVSDKEPLALE